MTPRDRSTASAIRTATLVSAVMIAFQVASRATRDALFLSSFDATSLPRMMAAAASASLLAVLATSWAMGRFGPSRLMPALFAASAALQLGEWALIARAPRLATVLFFLHISAIGALLVSGFWSLINERFDPHTAKQAIGRIGGAATAGGVVGGLLAERAATVLPVSAMLPLLALLNVICAILTPRIGTSSPRGVAEDAPLSAFRTMTGSRYLQTLAAVVVLAAISEGLLDYVFKSAAQGSLGQGARLLRLFSLFYATTSALGAALAAGAGRYALEKLGLARTVGLLPWTVAGGGALALVFPGLPTAMLARGGEAVMRNSLYRSGYEVLFTPLPPAEKRSVKALLDVGAVRIGDLLAAGLIQLVLVAALGGATKVLMILAILCAASGIMLTFAIHTGYVTTLERNLLHRAIQLDISEVKDSTTRLSLTQTIAQTIGPVSLERPSAAGPAQAAPAARPDPVATRLAELRSRDPVRVRTALRAGPLETDHVAAAIRLLAWDEVARAAIEALTEAAPRHTGQCVDALLNPASDFAVRRRITAPLARAATPRAVDGLLEGLHDGRFEVRFRCGRALARLGTDAPDLYMDAERVYAAVLHETEIERQVWESRRLLEPVDDDPLALGTEVRERASRSLEHVFTLLSLVLPRRPLKIAFRGLQMDDSQLRGTALEYLETALPPVVREKLWPFLGDRPDRTRRARPSEQIVADLLQSSEQSALDRRALPDPEGPV